MDIKSPAAGRVRFAPLVRRWTFDCLEKAVACSEVTNISIREDISRKLNTENSTSTLVVNGISSQRNRNLLSVVEDLKDEVVRRIVEGGTRMVVSIGLVPSATRTSIEDYVSQHFSSLPVRYPLSVDVVCILQDMALLALCRQKASDVVRCISLDSTVFHITIACPDRPKVYNRVSAALDLVASNILEADIMTTSCGFVLDRFLVNLKSKYIDNLNQVEDEISRFLSFNNRSLSAPASSQSSSCHVGQQSMNSAPSPTCNTTSNMSSSELNTQQDLESAAMLTEDVAGSNRASLLRNSLERNCQPPAVPKLERPQLVYDPGEACQSPKSRKGVFLDLTMDDVSEIQELGRGLSSITYSAVLWGSGTRVALKKVVSQSNEEVGELIQREVSIMRDLENHRNICRIVGACLGPPQAFICYEYLTGGSLWKLIHDQNSSYDYLKLASDVACGMKFLHSNNILHRDLKSANVLLDGTGLCKVSDFGLSCRLLLDRNLTAETGTYRWMAPEVIRHESYGTPADVYSFGVLLWELLVRDQPYSGMTPIQAAFGVAKDHLRPKLSSSLPARTRALMQRCWHPVPSMRPPFQEITELLPQLR